MARTIAQVLLTPGQLASALALARLTPEDPSPLSRSTRPPAREAEGPAFEALVQRGLVIRGKAPRPNLVFGIALATAARPDQVVRVQADAAEAQGYVLCRRGRFVVECTPGPLGLVSFTFPLTPRLAARALADPFRGPDGDASSFRFVGDAVETAVLATLLRAQREGRAIRSEALSAAVRAALVTPAVFAPLTLLGGGPDLVDAARSPQRIDGAIAELVRSGYVAVDRGDAGPSAAASRALGARSTAGVTLQCVRRTAGGSATSVVHLARNGAGSVLFRRADGTSGRPRFEWSMVDRSQLRALFGAAILNDAELTAAAP